MFAASHASATDVGRLVATFDTIDASVVDDQDDVAEGAEAFRDIGDGVG